MSYELCIINSLLYKLDEIELKIVKGNEVDAEEHYDEEYILLHSDRTNQSGHLCRVAVHVGKYPR